MIEENNKLKHCWCKYLGLVLATFTGAFLAFYFVADITVHHMMSPKYRIHKMEQFMKEQERMLGNIDKQVSNDDIIPLLPPRKMLNLIHIVKGDDVYKIIVDLKPFDNNTNNINVDVDGRIVTVSGKVEKNKPNSENIMSFSQAYEIPDNFDKTKITKVKKHNKYIITIPTIDD